MAKGVKLTKGNVDSLSATATSAAYLWDTKIPGFGVKALPSGKKRYVLKYRTAGGRQGTQRWLQLGTHGAITVEEARKLAQQAHATVARGGDPQATKVEARNQARMTDLWDRFEKDYLPYRKLSTQRDYRRYWDVELRRAFGLKAVREVSRGAVDRWHKGLSHKRYEANRMLALLSRLMSLAEAWEIRDQGTNPCRYVQRFTEQSRTRYLAGEELEALGLALGLLTQRNEKQRRSSIRSRTKSGSKLPSIRPDEANAIRMLLYTGARLNEILTAKLAWIDMNRRVIELPDSKTGKKPIYLSDAALEVLRDQQSRASATGSEYLFPGKSKAKHMVNLRKPWMAVCEEAKITGVRLHDLRHTAASIAVGQGVSLPIIGRLLGHTQAQTTLRYAHLDSDPALAAANLVGDALRGKI